MMTNPLIRYTLGKCLIPLFLFRPNEIVLPSKSQIRLTAQHSRDMREQNPPAPLIPRTWIRGSPRATALGGQRGGPSRLATELHLVPPLGRILTFFTSPFVVCIRPETLFPVTVVVRYLWQAGCWCPERAGGVNRTPRYCWLSWAPGYLVTWWTAPAFQGDGTGTSKTTSRHWNTHPPNSHPRPLILLYDQTIITLQQLLEYYIFITVMSLCLLGKNMPTLSSRILNDSFKLFKLI